jgi:probable rRNA maturation factor
MITIKNTQRSVKLPITQIKTQVQKMLASVGYPDYDVSLWFTSNATIRNYNKRFRGKDKPTDILSFPFHDLKPGQNVVTKMPDECNLGDIIISVAYAKKDCQTTWKRTFAQHLPHLLVHGIVHLLGYDHQTEPEYHKMHAFEQKLLKAISRKSN